MSAARTYRCVHGHRINEKLADWHSNSGDLGDSDSDENKNRELVHTLNRIETSNFFCPSCLAVLDKLRPAAREAAREKALRKICFWPGFQGGLATEAMFTPHFADSLAARQFRLSTIPVAKCMESAFRLDRALHEGRGRRYNLEHCFMESYNLAMAKLAQAQKQSVITQAAFTAFMDYTASHDEWWTDAEALRLYEAYNEEEETQATEDERAELAESAPYDAMVAEVAARTSQFKWRVEREPVVLGAVGDARELELELRSIEVLFSSTTLSAAVAAAEARLFGPDVDAATRLQVSLDWSSAMFLLLQLSPANRRDTRLLEVRHRKGAPLVRPGEAACLVAAVFGLVPQWLPAVASCAYTSMDAIFSGPAEKERERDLAALFFRALLVVRRDQLVEVRDGATAAGLEPDASDDSDSEDVACHPSVKQLSLDRIQENYVYWNRLGFRHGAERADDVPAEEPAEAAGDSGVVEPDAKRPRL
jgi:hypothetical protein